MAEVKHITVKSRGNITVSQKSKKSYFIITDQDDVKYISYKPTVFNDFGVSMEGDIEYDLPKFADGTNNLIGWKSVENAPQPPQSPTVASKSATQQELPKPKPIDLKNRAFSLSYAKDLAVAKIIVVDKILAYAETFRMYLDGGISLENPVDFTIEIMKHFKRLDDKPKEP